MTLRSTVLNKRVLGCVVLFSLASYTGAADNDAVDFGKALVGNNMCYQKLHCGLYIPHVEAYVSSGSKRWMA